MINIPKFRLSELINALNKRVSAISPHRIVRKPSEMMKFPIVFLLSDSGRNDGVSKLFPKDNHIITIYIYLVKDFSSF